MPRLEERRDIDVIRTLQAALDFLVDAWGEAGI